MEDSLKSVKVKFWYNQLDTVEKIKFLEYVWSIDRYKIDYASMSEPLRKFYSKEERP